MKTGSSSTGGVQMRTLLAMALIQLAGVAWAQRTTGSTEATDNTTTTTSTSGTAEVSVDPRDLLEGNGIFNTTQ